MAAPPASAAPDEVGASSPPVVETAAEAGQLLSLGQCLDVALRMSHRRPVSRFSLLLAEAQHRQALAGYWPQVTGKAGVERLSDPLNFIFPGTSVQVPAQTISIPGGSMVVTIPANAFAPGFPPSSIQMPVNFPNQTIHTAAQNFAVPQQNVNVLDPNVAMGSLNMNWLLFDGGMRKGYREQSAGFVDAMRQEARRTDLEIVDSVKQMYWGAVLARQLHRLGTETLARMEATLRLTEGMYQGGAGKVTKADYLDNQVMVESLRALVAGLEKNEAMSAAALANTMGMPWNASVQPSAQAIPFDPATPDVERLVGMSYEFSPDWARLEAGIRAAQGAVTTAQSGYYPKLALTGELHRLWNGGYRGGLATDQNMSGWTAGAGLEIPLFNGSLTRNQVSEMLARVDQLKETRFLLREGLGLRIKDLVLGLDAAVKSSRATERAMQAARDNRDLNERAYQNELVETEKVIRSQLMEALMAAQHDKSRYDCVALESELSLAVGTEVSERLRAKP